MALYPRPFGTRFYGRLDNYPHDKAGGYFKVNIDVNGKNYSYEKFLHHPGCTWIVAEVNPVTGIVTTKNIESCTTEPTLIWPVNTPIF